MKASIFIILFLYEFSCVPLIYLYGQMVSHIHNMRMVSRPYESSCVSSVYSCYRNLYDKLHTCSWWIVKIYLFWWENPSCSFSTPGNLIKLTSLYFFRNLKKLKIIVVFPCFPLTLTPALNFDVIFFEFLVTAGGGCGRFWNQPKWEIICLRNSFSRTSFCMVRY